MIGHGVDVIDDLIPHLQFTVSFEFCTVLQIAENFEC